MTHNLVQEGDVSREQAVRLEVVVELNVCKLVFRCVEDAGIPGLLRQRVNRDAGDLALGKLFRVGAPDLLHVNSSDGYIHLLRDLNECTGQPLVRMAGDFGGCQTERVPIHHCVGCSDLFLGHLSDIEARPNFALLLVGEPNKDVGMLARPNLYRFVQGRQKRCAAPVVDDPITLRNAIEVRADDDDLIGGAGQGTNHVGQL